MILYWEAKAGCVSGHDVNNLILRRAASLRAQREHERNDSRFEKSRGHFATLCRWFTLMTDTVRAVLLTRRRRRQSYALSAINIDSDKSLKERARGDPNGGVDQKPAESARLIEIYVDNIGRAINTRHAELHKSISDSRPTNRIFRFSLSSSSSQELFSFFRLSLLALVEK